jgi:hypothetical protein
MQYIETMLNDALSTMMTLAILCASLGFLGAGMMYVLSPIPVLAQWKANNPQAFNNVMIGLAIIGFAASGGVAAILAVA